MNDYFEKILQAEDGIRDIAVSRGLGDVYKRQGVVELTLALYQTLDLDFDKVVWDVGPVSYTHLTLPTNTPV